MGCQRDYSFTPIDEEWVRLDNKCIDPLPNRRREGRLKIAFNTGG